MYFGTETSVALFVSFSSVSSLSPSALQALALVGGGCDLGILPVPHEFGWLRTFCSSRCSSENFSFLRHILAGKSLFWGICDTGVWYDDELDLMCSKVIRDTFRAGLISQNFKCLSCYYMSFVWQVTSSLLISSDRLVISLFSIFFFSTFKAGTNGAYLCSTCTRTSLAWRFCLILCDTKVVFWRSVCD